MNTNPYKPPQSSAATSAESTEIASRPASPTVVFGLPLAGFVFGIAWYLVLSLAAEEWLMPQVEDYSFTYGQQAFLISLPTSILMGSIAGCCFVPMWIGHKKTAGVLLVILAMAAAFWITYIWRENDISGECTSKYVLFYPLYALNVVIFAVALFSFRSARKE